MSTPKSERSLLASIAAHESWANTKNRSARTAKARAALEAKFLNEADGDPVRAEHLRKAHFRRLALKSVAARRRALECEAEADSADSAIAALGGASR